MTDLEATLADLVRREVDRRLAELGVGAGGERLITVAAAAELVSVKPATIRAWIAEGRITPAGRAGRRLRLRAADVTAAIAGRARAAPADRPEALASRAVRDLVARSAAGTDRRGARRAARRG